MEYQLVYDLLDAGYQPSPVIGLMLIGVGAVMMIASRGRHPFGRDAGTAELSFCAVHLFFLQMLRSFYGTRRASSALQRNSLLSGGIAD